MRLGKPALCNECETENRVLELRGQYLWSRCLNCGFEECEWMFTDDPEYLKGLAKEYGITFKEIWEAVKKTVKLPTDVQRTILKQLLVLNPFFTIEYNIKTILWKDDGRSVRLHIRKPEVINIDIIYERGSDTYTVKAWKLKNHGLEAQEIYNMQDIYFDQLDDVIREITRK